jgi:hypothetical protein
MGIVKCLYTREQETPSDLDGNLPLFTKTPQLAVGAALGHK